MVYFQDYYPRINKDPNHKGDHSTLSGLLRRPTCDHSTLGHGLCRCLVLRFSMQNSYRSRGGGGGGEVLSI